MGIRIGFCFRWALCTALTLSPFGRLGAAGIFTVDSTAYGPMDGFELYGNGLYWWNSGNPADEINPARVGQVAVRTLVAGRFLIIRDTLTAFSIQTTSVRAFAQGVGRTDNSIFYFGSYGSGNRIYRRPVFGAAANDPGIDFSGVAYTDVGAILVSGSTVYWTVRGGAAAATGEVRSKAVDGPPGGGDAILGSGMGRVIKMRVVPVNDENGNFFRSFLYMLNDTGQLWRIGLPSIFQPTLGAPSVLASNVTDFDSRQESEQQFIPPYTLHTVYATRLYAATGVNLSDSRVSGRLVSFNLTDGSSYTFYDSLDVNLQVTGVAVDDNRIFISRTPLRFDGVMGGFGGWVYDRPNAQILRETFPAHRSILISYPMETIAFFQEGWNMRSDGQWLYFSHENLIRKIKTDSPAIALDYRAVGLEAVQAVQDYNNSVTLVAGKPTLVRAYAQQVQNTTGIPKFPVAGRLRAYRGGVLLPGEAWSYNDPIVDGAGDLATLRGDINRSFLFDLPGEWLGEEGALTLEFAVNPNGTAPETGATPLVNNAASATVNVSFKGTPCLMFVVVSSVYPNYDPNASDSLFGDILDRALTMLPAPGFKWRISGGSLTKPVVTLTGIKQRSFSIPADTSWALTLLSAVQWLTKNPAGCPDTHWVGMFPSAETNFNGQGEVSGDTLVMRMGAQNNGNWQGPRGGYSLAHELSHNYGRNHINTPTNCTSQVPASPYDSYNGSACTLGNPTGLNDPATPIGYDYRSGTLILPTMAGDLMSYANSRWISPQTWKRDLDSMPGGPAPAFAPAGGALPGPVLFVQGLLNSAIPSGMLLPAVQGQPGDFDSAKVQSSIDEAAALPATVPYRLRLLDAVGNVLLDVAALTSSFTGEPVEKLKFAQFLPLDPATARVQLLLGNQVLAEISASAHPPVLALNHPVLDEVNQTLSLTWTASDLDGDPLLFTVQFSPDNGASWQTLRVHDPSLGISISTKLMPGGDQCLLRLIATDGFQTTMAITDPFALGKHAPFLALAGLLDDQSLPYGANLSVRAFAYDAEEGSLDDTGTHWQLDGPQSRSEDGGNFSLNHLPPGAYALTLSATDADGNVGSRVVPFQVLPMAVPDTAEPVLDGLCVDAAYGVAPSVRLTPGLPEPSAKFVHAAGALFVCFNGLPRSDDGTTPANINFYVNSDGSPDATPQPDDQGFGVDENGIPYRSHGDGAGFVAQLPQDFSVQIFQSIGTWNAEFRIPDSLLGGWSRDSGLAIVFGHSFCVDVPFVGCISTPYPPARWPERADPNQPGSWAAVRLGAPEARSNTAPVAVASGPAVLSLSEPQTVSLDGAGSYDLDGDPLTFAWTQIDGPVVSLNDTTSATPSFTAPLVAAPATLTFRLTVNDGQADSAAAQVSIALVPVVANAEGGSSSKISVSFNVDGSANIQLCWPGAAGDPVVIQASTDLVSWENIATNAATSLATVLHLDLEAGLYPYRFYRAVSLTARAAPGAVGTALEFDGLDDRVVVPHGSALDAYPLTIAFWLKTSVDDANIRGLISKYADGSLNGYGLFLEAGRVRGFYFRDPSNYVWDGGHGLDSGFIADGYWHHFVIVVDTVSGRLYRDGSLVSTLAWTGVPGATSTAEPLQFGRYSNYPTALEGVLDEVAMWNRALSELELNKLLPGKLTGNEPSLIGFWPFEDGEGDTAMDASGHNHDGALVNGSAWIPSTALLEANPNTGNALRFDGLNDRVEVASNGSLNAYPLTVTAWIKTAQTVPGYVSVANKYVGGSANGYSLHIYNGRLYAFYFRGDGVSYVYAEDPGLDGGLIADGQWHHVGYVVDDDGGRIYVDGTQTASLAWTGTPGACTTTTPLRFGYYPLGSQTLSLDGRMDNVTLWNRVLTAAELNVLRRFSVTGTEFDLIGYWPFDNGTGITATDVTGHGNDGTLINGPIWVGSDLPRLP
jgi:Concanavalin A-like lectin/glucanases superfamily/K319L-like, PKD domain